ncbi:hypothetical protein MMPV_003075 [Pyropia vietnamensis]
MGALTKRMTGLATVAVVAATLATGGAAVAVPRALGEPKTPVVHFTDSTLTPQSVTPADEDMNQASDRSAGRAAKSWQYSRSINFESKSGKLFANGKPFTFVGVNWFGFETDTALVHGLWTDQSMDSLLDKVASLGYNSLRVPLALDNFLANPVVTAYNGDVAANKELNGKRMLDALDMLVKKAADRHLLILLDLHRLEAALWPDPMGLWYNERYCEADVVAAWKALAQRYCASWNVVGADLLNEPHRANWGSGVREDDWRLAAERLGNAVLDVCPRLLIFVEGVGNPPSTPIVAPIWAFWGENLANACSHPVRLSNPQRLVYSPHVYGPSVSRMDYFADRNFPANLDAVWEAHFGKVTSCSSTAMVIGEFGGNVDHDKDLQFQERFVGWMINRGVGGFVWALNPNSGDTKGIVGDDWKTPVEKKKGVYSRLQATNVQWL